MKFYTNKTGLILISLATASYPGTNTVVENTIECIFSDPEWTLRGRDVESTTAAEAGNVLQMLLTCYNFKVLFSELIRNEDVINATMLLLEHVSASKNIYTHNQQDCYFCMAMVSSFKVQPDGDFEAYKYLVRGRNRPSFSSEPDREKFRLEIIRNSFIQAIFGIYSKHSLQKSLIPVNLNFHTANRVLSGVLHGLSIIDCEKRFDFVVYLMKKLINTTEIGVPNTNSCESKQFEEFVACIKKVFISTDTDSYMAGIKEAIRKLQAVFPVINTL